MLQIIDRRLAGKNKSIGNRERFLNRHKSLIRDAVRKAVSTRGIGQIDKDGANVTVPRRDIAQPVFRHGQGGVRDMVHPGNKEYVEGTPIARPESAGSGGGGAGTASNDGSGEDDFIFHLTKEEFMQVFFEDMGLPNLERSQDAEIAMEKSRRAGYVSEGNPSSLHVVRSMRAALGRRIALGSSRRADLAEAQARLDALIALRDAAALAGFATESHAEDIAEARRALDELEARPRRVPWLDPIDLSYRARVKVPDPGTKAVMFCLMDVSGSMNEARKDLSKRFFILLYLFLTRHYEKIDLVFIRHNTQAMEVNEHDFFNATESGGTVVSSALVLMDQIIRARYSDGNWNIYGAQASDGDNYTNDNQTCRELLCQSLLPACRYFAYLQVYEGDQELWDAYSEIAGTVGHMAIRKVSTIEQIYPVFRDLFRKTNTQPAIAAA